MPQCAVQHLEKYISDFSQIERNMIEVIFFHLNRNQVENFHHDHISFNLKGALYILFSVQYNIYNL